MEAANLSNVSLTRINSVVSDNKTVVINSMKDLVILSTQIFFSLLNIIIHASGCYLLNCAKKTSLQKIYLLNLAATLLVKHAVLIASPILIMLGRINTLGFQYFSVNYTTGVGFLYYTSIYYITIDRLFGILASLKYAVYWNRTKAMLQIKLTWMVGILCSLGSSLACKFFGFNHGNILYYVYDVFDFVFVVLAILTYWFMFTQYTKSKRRMSSRRQPDNVRQYGVWHMFSKSRFFIAVLLIGNFLVFATLPDFVQIITTYVTHSYISDMTVRIFTLSSQIADVFDGYIYIFLQPCVKKVLCEKFKRLKRSNQIQRDRECRVFHVIGMTKSVEGSSRTATSFK